MRIAIIDDELKADAARVVAYAHEHRYNLHELHRLMAHPEEAPGHNPNFVVNVKGGVRCVFTFEQQPDGWMRHISISVNHPTNLPHPVVVDELLPLFGFKKKMAGCYVHVMHERVVSVNVLDME